jgi:hypothetical protein
MLAPPVGLFGALHCQCRRTNKGPASRSPTAPRSIRVTWATVASAMGITRKGCATQWVPVSWLPEVVGLARVG